MNRKIAVVVLAIMAVLCLCFGACSIGNGTSLTKQEALDLYIFTQNGQVMQADELSLPKVINGYRVTWSTESPYAEVTKRSDDYLVAFSLPEEDVEVVLTIDLMGVTKDFTVKLKALTAESFASSYNFANERQVVYADFALDTQTTYKGRVATIAWSVTDEASMPYISVEDNVCKVNTSTLNPSVKINATFTYGETTYTKVYTFKVSEAMEHLQEVNYWYTNTGVSITMNGYVVAIGTEYSATYGNVTLYMVDENGDAGYYLYRVQVDSANAANLKVGAYVTCTGTTNTNYNGLIETNAGGTLEVDATKEIVDPYDMVKAIDNDLLSDAPALVYNESRMVSLTNWTVKTVADDPSEGSTATILTLTKGGKTITVAVSKYLEGAYLTKSSDATYKAIIDKKNTIKEGDVISVTGILGNYKGYQIMPLCADDIVVGGEEDTNGVAEGKKVSAAITAVKTQIASIPTIITEVSTYTLPTDVDGVEVSYRLLGTRTSFAFDGGNLSVVPGVKEVASVEVTYSYEGYETVTYHSLAAANLDDQGKADLELSEIEFDVEVKKADSYALPELSYFAGKENCGIAWVIVSDAPYATVSGTTLLISDLPLEAERLTIKAVITIGSATAEREYYLDVPAMAAYVPEYATEVKAGEYVAYALYQANLGSTLYFAGTTDSTGNYLASTTDASKAAKVVVAEVYDGETFKGYTLNAGGKYIEIVTSGTYNNAALVDESTGVWAWNDEAKVLTWTNDVDTFYLGTYNTYNTISASKISFITGEKLSSIGTSNFPIYLVSEIKTATAKDILDGILATLETKVSEDFVLPFKASWEVKEGSAIELNGLNAIVTKGDQEQTVVLTATLVYNGETATADVTFTVAPSVVLDHDGTEADPYSIKDAVALASSLANKVYTEKVFTKGVIKSIGTTGSFLKNVYLTDCNDSTVEILLYSVNFSDTVTSVKVGDIVVVESYIVNYNGTLELSGKNSDYAYFRSKISIDHEGTEADPYSIKDAVTIASGLENKVYTEKVFTKGVIKSIGTTGSYLKNVYLTDCDDSTIEILLYSVNFSDTVTAVEIGDVVVVESYIVNFNGTLELSGKGSDYAYFRAVCNNEGEGGEGGETTDPTVPDYTQCEEKTLAAFIDLEDGETMYKIAGVVSATNNNGGTFNFYVTDGANVLYVYSLAAGEESGVVVGKHVVLAAAKKTYFSTIEAVNAVVLELSAASDLENIWLAQLSIVVPASVNGNFALPTYEGVSIAWVASGNGIAINGAEAVVTQTSEAQAAVLTATFSYGTATLTVNYNVEVSAKIVGVQTLTYDFVSSFSTYAADWSNSYVAHTISMDGATINLTASKQSGTSAITDRPVIASKSSATYVELDMGSIAINEVTFNLKRWTENKKFVDVHVECFVNGEWVKVGESLISSTSAIALSDNEVAYTVSFDANTKVRLVVVASASNNQQIGLTSIVVKTVG